MNLANGLAPQCVVEILTLNREAFLNSELESGVRLRKLASGNHYLAFPFLVHYLVTVRPDVLVCKLRRACVMGLVAGWLTRTPVVVIQDTVFDRRAAKRQIMERLLDRYAPLLYRNALAVVVPGKGMSRLAAQYGLSRVCCVPNALDLERIESWAKVELRLPENYLLWAGRLVPEKDPLLALRAFALLGTNHHLVILGEGEMASKCAIEARRLGIEDRVVMPGWASNPYPWIAAAKAVFLTSHYEGCPNVLLEAMALGTTVVSVDCPATAGELLDHERFGYLSRSREPERLAQKLKSALISPIPRERLQQESRRFCRKRVAELFYQEMCSRVER